MKDNNIHVHTAKCQHVNHKNKCYGENIYNKVDNEKRLNLLKLVKEEGKSLKEAAKSLNINYSTAKTILRVFRIENRILKKSPYQKRSRISQKNKLFNFNNANNSHNSDSNNCHNSQGSQSHFESDPHTLNNFNFPGFESSNNLNLHLTQMNSSNNIIKENLIGFPGLVNIGKEKMIFKEIKNISGDGNINISNLPTQNNSASGNICSSPLLNIGGLTNNTSRLNSYPASSNPSNNNLTNLTDFNLNNNANNIGANNGNSNNNANNLYGINISNNSNFVTASNVPLGNINTSTNNNNNITPNNINMINSNNNNNSLNGNNFNNMLNHFVSNNSNYCNNYVSDFPEIYKSTEEFMENFYSLVNMLKSCIGEIINNEYTIRSLSNIIKTMANNQQMNSNNGNLGYLNNSNNGNIECSEIKQNYSDVLNKQNK